MSETYAYDEDAMMKGIQRFRKHPSSIRPAPSPMTSAQSSLSRLVVARAASLFGVSVPYLLGPCRERRLMFVREAVIFVLRNRYGYSFPRIGSLINRHHTSIFHAFTNAVRHYQDDDTFREKVQIMLDEAVHPPCEAMLTNDALAILDLDRMCNEIECDLPQALHRLADAIEDGSIEGKASAMAAAGPLHDLRAHCRVVIQFAAPIRKRIAAETLEDAE